MINYAVIVIKISQGSAVPIIVYMIASGVLLLIRRFL